MGRKGYSRARVRELLSGRFRIREEFQLPAHSGHYFFVLEKA